MDFLRFAQPAIIATAGAVIVVLVISYFAIKALSGSQETAGIVKYVKNVRNAVLFLLVLVFVWQLLVAASVNNVNRSVIDRSGLNTQRYVPTATPYKP